jgi:hypothetical protein
MVVDSSDRSWWAAHGVVNGVFASAVGSGVICSLEVEDALPTSTALMTLQQ